MKRLFLSLLLVSASLFGQAPSPKPQPSTPTYGVDELALYPAYDRASFESMFGVQAPAFDPSRPPKAWFDSTVSCVANLTTTFKVMNDNTSNGNITSMSLPSCDVGKVNLPGRMHFPQFAPNTVQNVEMPAFPTSIFGPRVQSTQKDAEALKTEIGDTSLVIKELPGLVRIDKTSPVGYFMLGDMNVELALLQRYSNGQGIGSPGKWVKVSSGVYTWVAAQPVSDGTDGSVPAVKVPVRDLLPNEKFTTQVLGILPITMVMRTDVGAAPVTGSVSGGGFTDDDRATLRGILDYLQSRFGK